MRFSWSNKSTIATDQGFSTGVRSDNPRFICKIRSDRNSVPILYFSKSKGLPQYFQLLAPPVIAVLEMATNRLPLSLLNIENQWLQLLLAPINSAAAAIAVGALVIVKFFRRVLG